MPSESGAVVRLVAPDPFAHPALDAWVAAARRAPVHVEVEGPPFSLSDPTLRARLVSLAPDLIRIELPSVDEHALRDFYGRDGLGETALEVVERLRDAGLPLRIVVPVNRLTTAGLASTLEAFARRFGPSLEVELSRRPLRIAGPESGRWEEAAPELAGLADALANAPALTLIGDTQSTLPACLLPESVWSESLVPQRRPPRLPTDDGPTPACASCAFRRACGHRPGERAVPAESLRPLDDEAARRLNARLGEPGTAAVPSTLRRTDRSAFGLPDLLCFAPFTSMSISELRHRPVPCAQAWVDTLLTTEQEAAALGVASDVVAALDARVDPRWNKAFIDSMPNAPRWHELQNEDWPLDEVWNAPLLRHMRRQMLGGGASDRCRSSCRVLLGVEERGINFFTVPDGELSPAVVANRRLLVEDLQEGRDRLRAKPLEINTGVSSHCNIDCGFCHGPRGVYGELSDRRLEELKGMLPTLMALSIVGPGEPLMSPAFGRLLEHVSTVGYPSLRLSLTTNGTLLTPGWLARHQGVRWDHLRISVNAGTAATWERMTGKPHFARLVENIEAVAELRARSATPFTFTLSCVLSNLVLEDLEELLHFAELVDRVGASVVVEPVTGDDFSPFTDPVRLERLATACAAVARAFETRNPAIARAFLAMVRFTSERTERRLFQLLPRR